MEAEASAFASAYGAIAEAVVVNGIECMKYASVENYEGDTYNVINYMFEDDTYIVEISFWTSDTEAEYAAIDEIMGTLKKN